MWQYHFIRQDIPVAAQIIQMGHAIDQMSLRLAPTQEPSNSVLIGVQYASELGDIFQYLCKNGFIEGLDFYLWYEPGWPEGYNSIATRPMNETERKLFDHFTLYDERNNV